MLDPVIERGGAASQCLAQADSNTSRRTADPPRLFCDGRDAGDRWRYRGTITREQWLLAETRTVARLRLDGLSDERIVEQVVNQNLFQYPTERELKSISRACLLRLDNLSDDPGLRQRLTRFIARGLPAQASQTNLYAIMRTYRVVWEFMVGVVGEKFCTLDAHLAKYEVTAFLESLRSQSEVVAAWSDATLNKIRQVLTKCLVECGYLESPRSDELRPILLDLELEDALRANGDAVALPAFACLE